MVYIIYIINSKKSFSVQLVSNWFVARYQHRFDPGVVYTDCKVWRWRRSGRVGEVKEYDENVFYEKILKKTLLDFMKEVSKVKSAFY